MISIALNLLLMALLCGALWMGWRLNQRLMVLREGQLGFAKAVAELDNAAARAERGLADLKAASDEMAEVLVSRIERARILAARLDQQFEAGASKTTQMAPPRRKTAAPAGLAKGKVRTACPWPRAISALTIPPFGSGSGRSASSGGASATDACSGVGPSGAGSAGSGLEVRFTHTEPSATPDFMSASLERVRTSWVRPPAWAMRTASIHRGGEVRNRERSGRVAAGKVTVSTDPSRRVETPGPKSSRVKSEASPTRTA